VRPSVVARLARTAVVVTSSLVLLTACGAAPAPATDAHAGASATEPAPPEPAPPEVSKRDFEDLTTRVLELELRMRNLQAARATGGPIVGTGGMMPPGGDACSVGTEQSPIDLSVSGALVADIANPVLDYGDTDAATVVHDGHAIEIGVGGAGTLALEGEIYELQRIRFHGPSEHTIDGVHAPLEAHFVHATVDGGLAVVAVLIDAGAAAPGYDPVIGSLPTDAVEQGTPQPIAAPVVLRSLLPEQTTAYRYRGSLTSPPCTEGVSWIVLSAPMTMSQAQIDAIVASTRAPNNRPTQQRRDRVVGLDVTP
jgi:carbonic anhydrase